MNFAMCVPFSHTDGMWMSCWFWVLKDPSSRHVDRLSWLWARCLWNCCWKCCYIAVIEFVLINNNTTTIHSWTDQFAMSAGFQWTLYRGTGNAEWQ
jgi:hypothetical protein